MKIETIFGDKDALVVAYYYVGEEKFYLFVPNVDPHGVNVAKESECKIVDSNSSLFLEKGDIYVHSAVLDSDLLDKLINHDEGSIAELNSKLSSFGDNGN